jgi:hypothetical protein
MPTLFRRRGAAPFFALCLVAACGGGDGAFVPPGPPDAHLTLDLASTYVPPPPDLACFNNACGSCSSWAKWDGTPAQPGDPCSWKGTLQCNGNALVCSDTSCLSCPKAVSGTVCGADGHTILELLTTGSVCAAYDFGSAIAVCNRSAQDQCRGSCSVDGSGNYACAAHCTSDGNGDAGVGGCPHGASDSCTSLTGC